MGLVRKPILELYWSKKEIYDTPFIYKNITRDRYSLLLRFLHFNDNEFIDENSSRLYRLQPLLEKLTENFRSTYTPGSSVVIDESLIPFRGRLSFRQYIPGKTHKYGVKLYKICSPNAYTWDLKVYIGNMERTGHFTHSESIVLQLCRPFLGQGVTVFADNFYSSVPLAEKLLKEHTLYCGTFRKNRKHVPKSLQNAKLKKGEIVSKQNANGVKVFNWKDKRNVLTISTIPEHSGELVSSGKKSRTNQHILKPKSVLDYNGAKKGVDMSDQMASYSTALRRSTKWYRKVAAELLTGTSVVNAWTIYNMYYSAGKDLSITEFKEKIATQLVTGKEGEIVKSGSRSASIGGAGHEHTLVESTGNSKSRKRCRECYKMIAKNEGTDVARKKCRRVKTFCDDCDDKPFMCVSCFGLAHSK